MSPGRFIIPAVVLAGAAACSSPDKPTPEVCRAMQGVVTAQSQCGPTAEFTPVNCYDGEFAAVQEREDAVVLINGSCTGTLIAAAAGPVVLTAGHCVGLGDQSLLAFNYEDEPDGDPLVTNGTVIELAAQPDYALIQLDRLPAVAPTPLTTRPSDRLAVIQHPRGAPKSVAEGDLAEIRDDVVYYRDLDTLAGSSGAGVLTLDGFLLAVHTDGDCATDGSGSNRGWSAASIVAASAYLQDVDIADR